MRYYPEKPKPVEIKNDGPIKMKLVGIRWWIVAIISLAIYAGIDAIYGQFKTSNQLKEEELKIRKEQLDLTRRQFQLDSIIATKNEKIR